MQRDSLTPSEITLTYHRDAHSFHTDSQVVEAALVIAMQAHQHQIRGKADKSLPYIIHPIMVHDLLYSHGVRDEIQLAAALLHDAKEDCPAYLKNPDQMREDLTRALLDRGIADAEQIAEAIDGICTELTNDSEMNEGKRTWQVEHAGRISRRGAELKILDQLASVLDGIMEPDDEEFPDAKKRKWNRKALNVVKSAASDREGLHYWKDLFKVAFSYQMNMLDHPEQAAELRAAFNFSDAVEQAVNYPAAAADIPAYETVLHARIDEAKVGCVAVDLSVDGKVVGYSILANPNGGKGDARNAPSVDLVSAIEDRGAQDKRRATVQPTQILQGRLVREVKIKPPLEVEQFLGMAKEAGAIGEVFALKTRNEARAMGNAQGIS